MTFYYEKFVEIRKAKRWSAKVLAEKCNVSRQAVSGWEHGRLNPSEKNIRKLAAILNVPVSQISTYQDSIPTSARKKSSTAQRLLSTANSADKKRWKTHNTITKLMKQKFKSMEQTSIVTKTILNSIDAIFYIKDKNSQYIAANEKFNENLKLNPGYDATGKTDMDLFFETEAEMNHKEDLEIIITGNTIEREDYIPGSHKTRWGLITKTPIFEKEKIVGVLGYIVDTTERKKLEKTLQFITNSIHRMQNKKMFYGILDKNIKFIYTDRKAFEEVLGFPIASPIHDWKTWFNEIVHPNDREKQISYVASNFSNVPTVREYRIIHPKKGLRWIRANFSQYMGTFMSFSTDITDEK